MDFLIITGLVYLVLCLGSFVKLYDCYNVRGWYLLCVPVLPIILLIIIPIMIIVDTIKSTEIGFAEKVISCIFIILQCVGQFPVNVALTGMCIASTEADVAPRSKVIKPTRVVSKSFSSTSDAFIIDLYNCIVASKHGIA